MLSAVAALGALPAGYAFGVEPHWLETVVQPVWIPGLRGSVRILHLSDLHASFEVPLSLIATAADAGLQSKPDVVCLTGDFITRTETLDWATYSRILQRISAGAPTFAVLGNHDGGYWAGSRGGHADPSFVTKLLQDSGITVLHNAHQVVTTAKSSFCLAGVGDLWTSQVDMPAALGDAPAEVPKVLMAHNPDTKELTGRYGWDLMLCGHTHGGQVLFPLVGEPYKPVRDRRYISGLNNWQDRQIYTTRGVGSLCGVRFNCRPEITILELQG
jgi:uncharacterized protein